MNRLSFNHQASCSAALVASFAFTLSAVSACSAPIGVKSDSGMAAGKGAAGKRAAAGGQAGKSAAPADNKGSAGAKAAPDGSKSKPDGGTLVGAGGSDADDEGNSDSSSNASGASGSPAQASAGSYANGAAGQASGTPAMLADACMGKADEYACDRSVLYHCTEMGAYDREKHCSTPGQCKAGLKTGECGVCDPGSARCKPEAPETPETCTEDGKWEEGTPCASAALCNAMTGSCDMSGCSAGQVRCNGDVLEVCKDDLTGFDMMKDCGPGLCNADKQRCNDCVPDTVKCADTSSLNVCSADGTETPQACSGDKAFCKDDKCVQCLAASDCKPASECLDPVCNNGACGAGTPKALKTPCQRAVSGGGAGVCDLIGNCVTCIDDSDCHDPSKRCNPANVFSPCESRSPLEATVSLLGGYTVTVAPGYRVTIEKPATLNLSINLGTVPCSGSSCVLPATGQATTYTFSGPSCDGRSLLQTRTEVVTLQFGDGSSAPDAGLGGTVCSNVVTLTATSK